MKLYWMVNQTRVNGKSKNKECEEYGGYREVPTVVDVLQPGNLVIDMLLWRWPCGREWKFSSGDRVLEILSPVIVLLRSQTLDKPFKLTNTFDRIKLEGTGISTK